MVTEFTPEHTTFSDNFLTKESELNIVYGKSKSKNWTIVQYE
jgi:hypothetical protein